MNTPHHHVTRKKSQGYGLLLLVLFSVAANPEKIQAATITAVSSGNWGTNSVWNCNCQPTNADNIIIPSGITITASGPKILFLGPVITITVSGTLTLNNGSLQVDSNDIVSVTSGGKISGTGITGGQVYSGVVPIFIPNGSDVNGPSSITAGALPIELLFFKGEFTDTGVLLEWASAYERDFGHYEIERSYNGKDFESIGITHGRVSSTQRVEYAYTDTTPLFGKSYYRLKAVDLDGSVELFSPIAIQIEASPYIDIFPNPATGPLHINLNFYPHDGGDIILYNSHGGVSVCKKLLDTQREYVVDVPTADGFYFLVVATRTENFKSTVVVK